MMISGFKMPFTFNPVLYLYFSQTAKVVENESDVSIKRLSILNMHEMLFHFYIQYMQVKQLFWVVRPDQIVHLNLVFHQ